VALLHIVAVGQRTCRVEAMQLLLLLLLLLPG
jgi:hypothetical protein